jgi:hypothetical protein
MGNKERAGEQPPTTPEAIAFRASLWRDFLASYQRIFITDPDRFSEYCAAFRGRWIAGK